MNVIAYGGGSNSTAMLIGMVQKKIPIDLILFADTGAERPETYEFIWTFDNWLIEHEQPHIIPLEYTTEDGNRMSLEDECLKSSTLPALAYGYKRCSLKHKKSVQDKFCNNFELCKVAWKSGEKVTKFIGYDAGEERRRQNAIASDMVDEKYSYCYALIDWGWDRDECQRVIEKEGLPLPGKSSCFFCPSMKRDEIKLLRKEHPDLFERALAIEDKARPNLQMVKGLGRNYSWRDFIEGTDNQVMLCGMLTDLDTPCGCYDG